MALFQAQPEGLGLFFPPSGVIIYTTLILPCWAEK
jgi:hypothetical protein